MINPVLLLVVAVIALTTLLGYLYLYSYSEGHHCECDVNRNEESTYHNHTDTKANALAVLLRELGLRNRAIGTQIHPEHFYSYAQEFIDLYQKGGRKLLMMRLAKIPSFDNLQILEVLTEVENLLGKANEPAH